MRVDREEPHVMLLSSRDTRAWMLGSGEAVTGGWGLVLQYHQKHSDPQASGDPSPRRPHTPCYSRWHTFKTPEITPQPPRPAGNS